MPKLVALEWDAREARIAVGSPRGNDVVVEQVLALELTAAEADATPSISEISAQIAGFLSNENLTGNDALIALPRSSIELRTLNLPQAPPEEIPDMVRFQAMQAFTSIGEDWPVDYIELDSHEDSINVLAAVVSPQLVKQAREVCAASELKERCLVLRPFAAVSLLHRFESIDVFRTSLVVDLLPDSADLTVISNGSVVFMRSVRLPKRGEARTQATSLVGELRRTIGAAQNQMGGSRIEQIIICGGESEHAVLREAVADALSLDVITFDPFDAVRHTQDVTDNLPAHAGRFAPLLGMLACEVTGSGHTINFLNPRKRPEPPSKARRNLAVFAAAATVALLGLFIFLSMKKSMDDQIAQLTKQSAEMDDLVKKSGTLVSKMSAIESFEKGDVTWLDELREVAMRIPDADKVILKEVRCGVDPVQGGGRMTLIGNTSSSDVIPDFEEDLWYGNNRVRGIRGTIDHTQKDYPYQMETTVFVPPDVLENGHPMGRPPLDDEKQTPNAATAKTVDATQQVVEDAAVDEKFTSQEDVQPGGNATDSASADEARGDSDASEREEVDAESPVPEQSGTSESESADGADQPQMEESATNEPEQPASEETTDEEPESQVS